MIARCVCGNIELETIGAAIVCAACHCSDCQEGARRIEALPNACPILDSYGGTPYILFRKDRIKYLKGTEFLKSLKVRDDSPTNRIYAGCCNSFLTLDLPSPMHWIPIDRDRIHGEKPPLEMRINAKFKAGSGLVPRDAPVSPAIPFKFVMKLLRARLAMAFRR